MSTPVYDDSTDLTRTNLKCQELDADARRLARKLGISEAELAARRIGEGVVRLERTDELLKAVHSLGIVLAVTRNDHVVHEKPGRYANVTIGPERGIVLNQDIDLRLTMFHWRHAFAVTYDHLSTVYSSLQFFDSQGNAVHKIWMPEASDHLAYQDIVARFSDRVQDQAFKSEPSGEPPNFKPDDHIDRNALHEQWAALHDTHDFNGLLKAFNIGRHQALRLIGRDFAQRLRQDAALQVLLSAAATETPVIVFVGNAGCLQIHTGPVMNVTFSGSRWLRVVDPSFRMSLHQDRIGSSWVVRKPTRDGVLTSLEIFDRSGQLMVQFFGAREPGTLERQTWRNILSELTIQ